MVLLKALGYRVTAVSGRESTHDYLRQLGADTILPRSDRGDPSAGETTVGGRGGYRWRPGVGQSAGANAISRLRRRLRSGRGFDLPTTVMPFILRNVRLQGWIR